MLNSRKWSIGLGVVLLGGGVVFAEAPTMRSILRRPAPQAQTEAKGDQLASKPSDKAPSERKLLPFANPIVLPRGKAQADNPREALKEAAANMQPPDITFEAPGKASRPSTTEVTIIPTPTVDDNPFAESTRPAFDPPPFPQPTTTESDPNSAIGSGVVKEENPTAHKPEQSQPIPSQMRPNQLHPQQNQQQPNFWERRRMRRAAAANAQPQQLTPNANARALASDDVGPSILDIEMPSDAVPDVELPAEKPATVALPVGFEIPAQAKAEKQPLFSTK